MTKRPDILQRYRAVVPPRPKVSFGRWHVSPAGVVWCESMPSWAVPAMPEGYAVRGSAEDVENERAAREKAAAMAAPAEARPVRMPPAPARLRPQSRNG